MSTTPGDYVYQLLSRKYSDRKNHWRIVEAAHQIGTVGWMIPRKDELLNMKYYWKFFEYPEEEADSKMHQIADIMDEYFTAADNIVGKVANVGKYVAEKFPKSGQLISLQHQQMIEFTAITKRHLRNKTILRELKDHPWMWMYVSEI